VIHFVEWAKGYFGLGADDRVSGHSPLHFDLSMFDIFGAFAAGATLCLVPPELNVLAHRLADFIRSARLTQWFSVPSVLNYLARFDAVRRGDFPALRRVLWCGETLPTPTLIHWMKRLPHAAFTMSGRRVSILIGDAILKDRIECCGPETRDSTTSGSATA